MISSYLGFQIFSKKDSWTILIHHDYSCRELQRVADVADSCRRYRQLQTVAGVAGVADVAEKVATQALKSGVAENVKTVTGTNFK